MIKLPTQIPRWWISRPNPYFLDPMNMGCSFFVFLSRLQFKMCAHFLFYKNKPPTAASKKLKNEWAFVLMLGSGSKNWTSFFLICSAGAQPAWIMLVLLGDNDWGDLTRIWHNFSFRVGSPTFKCNSFACSIYTKKCQFWCSDSKGQKSYFSKCKDEKLMICDLNSMGAVNDWFLH